MKRFIKTLLHNLLLAFLAFVWLVPIVWLVVTSFSAYTGMNTSTFFPKEWSLVNYKNLLFSADSVAQFPNWFKNTFIIACVVCVISTAFVLMVAYATSCMRFPARKPLMNAAVIVNLFPGVLSMIAVYFILKTLNLTNTHLGLILVYSAGSGLGYLIAKGFFDTIPNSLREAAYLDGASEATIFWKVVIPMSRPIITVISSFLSPWKDANGNYQFEGRFNQGVVSLNLPQIGILSKGDEDAFWKLLDQRLQLCFEALMCRHNALKNVHSDSSPIHWQYGAIARLPKGAPIEPLLYGGYSSISLGYIGLYEVTKLMKGVSHTDPQGQDFALRVMDRLRKACDDWKKETNIGFALYGPPAESLCYRFARIDKERFGTIPDVTDKGYYTNSYHVDVREHIDAFDKFTFESQFQKISTGGCISYVEIPNMRHNLEALKEVVRFIYDNIQYAEFNTKSDYCQVCGYDGEIIINDDNQWECPACHNKDQTKMNVTRRTCGYLGENYWNVGKTKEIKSRVLHL